MGNEEIVQNIKNYCSKKGIKPTPACKEAGVGTSFINDLERGKEPSFRKIQVLAHYFGVTTSELLGEEQTIYRAKDQHIDPLTQKAIGIFQGSSVYQRQRMLEMIKMYKRWEKSAPEGKKENGPAGSGATGAEPEHYYEGDEPVEEGAYMCSGCKKTIIRIKESVKTLGACPLCNNIYWIMT